MYMMRLLSWQRPVSIIIYHGLYIIHILRSELLHMLCRYLYSYVGSIANEKLIFLMEFADIVILLYMAGGKHPGSVPIQHNE